MNRYSEADRKRALALHRRSWGYRRIAQVFGCAESTVKKWVEHAEQEKHPKPDHSPQKRRAAIEHYRKNESASIAGTAKKYGVHPKTMARWLESEGVETRQRPTRFSRKDIEKDIGKGMSGAAIARKYQCSESYVSAIRNGRI
jgi:transposase-like protein